MCSSRNLCGRSNGSRSSSSASSGSGAHYALCALGVGLIALGIVMIVWTVIPMDGEKTTSAPSGNNTAVPGSNAEEEEEEDEDRTKSSSVALVLVGVGVAMLLLSICLGVRSKRRTRETSSQPATATSAFLDHRAVDEEEPVDPNTYNVPSYEEVVGSGDYPVRQSNLRNSTSQLPSYEDILAAVENEGAEPTADVPAENAPVNDDDAAAAQPSTDATDQPSSLRSQPSLPARSASRASRFLRPLRVRRIKSDKLHLKDFRLQIRTPTQNPVTIEPITPPPGYEQKMPELQ